MTVLKFDDFTGAIRKERRTKLLQILGALPINLYLFINDYYMASTILCLLIVRQIHSRRRHPVYLRAVMQLSYDGASRETVRAVLSNGRQKLFSVEKIVPVSDANSGYFSLKRWMESRGAAEETQVVGLKGDRGDDQILQVVKEDITGTYFDAITGVEVKAHDRPERFFFYFKYEGEVYTVWFMKTESTMLDLMELMRIITGGRFREPKPKPDMVKLISEQINQRSLEQERKREVGDAKLEIEAKASTNSKLE